jgi:hypothetical protein
VFVDSPARYEISHFLSIAERLGRLQN